MPTDRLALESEQGDARGWGTARTSRLEPVLGFAPTSVLDVGCSRGGYVEALRTTGVAAVGIDLLRDEAWSVVGSPFAVADAARLPVRASSFDGVIAFETLEHVPESAGALLEWRRIAQRFLVLSVPDTRPLPWGQHAGLARHHWVDRTHVNFFDADSIATAVTTAGFRVLSVTSIMPLNPFVPALDALGLPPRIVNGVGRRMTRLARRRYGSSLLVVATAS